MTESSSYYRYPDRQSYVFKDINEAVLGFIVAVTCIEYARFMRFSLTHPSRKDDSTSIYLNVYTVAQWAGGNIDSSVTSGREPSSKEDLKNWATSMLEFNSFFRENGVLNPIGYLESKGLISWDSKRLCWIPVIKAIEKFTGERGADNQ